MKIIPQKITIQKSELDPAKLHTIEKSARLCYKSEGRFSGTTNEKFLRNLVRAGHESTLEHEKVTLVFTTDRGVTHELVRHRLASYSQESTRYCNYGQDRFGSEIVCIDSWLEGDQRKIWLDGLAASEKAYMDLLKAGATPEDARSVLPNSLKAEIAVTMNFRAWRHFIKLRADKASHPQIRELATALHGVFVEHFTCLFDDIGVDKEVGSKVEIEIIE